MRGNLLLHKALHSLLIWVDCNCSKKLLSPLRYYLPLYDFSLINLNFDFQGHRDKIHSPASPEALCPSRKKNGPQTSTPGVPAAPHSAVGHQASGNSGPQFLHP